MKFIRVNMTDQTIRETDFPQEYVGLGGRGLTSILINTEVPADCDPLGPDNKLVLAGGLLTGTRLVNTGRISIGAKSSLTGGIKESNVGGSAPHALGQSGIAALVVEGQAPGGKYWVLRINAGGQASLEPADEFAGLRTYDCAEKMLARYGEKNGLLLIGPAGEQQLASASVQSTDVDKRPCRAAGRGGMGAVMGAKGLKAIVVSEEGSAADASANSQAFKDAAKAVAQAIAKNPFTGEMLRAVGTAGLVSAVNGLGAFPSLNATQGQLEDHEKISGETLAATVAERGGRTGHKGCTGCIIHCSNEYMDTDGKYVTASLEYETLWSMGGMPGITDLDAVARLDYLCDDIGLDTINTGVAVGVAMDAGYKEFGDAQAAIDMLEEVARGSEIGKIIGNGPAAVGQHFNHSRIPAVKNQSIAAYDPRGMQGNGVTYATSPMGADHTAGNLVGAYLTGQLKGTEPDGQVDASRESQISMAMVDNTGLCMLAASAMADPAMLPALVAAINVRWGSSMTPDDLVALGVRTLQAEIEFNRKAGLTPEDDRLPQFFYEEPLAPHNAVFKITPEELDKTLEF
ncbi:Tungsten-containing aldehyde:ferredoxin oxidoreductase (EC [Olavius algarvensis Delta 1 endosymbiont]|nr:Tungsten-containing aldehyde:ferredoxin oxidoreductase (EC [Olavius algarvensis Delta 1 endosymbiont]